MSYAPPDRASMKGLATRLVHAGRDPSAQHGFINPPIVRGSTVLYPTSEDWLGRNSRYKYGTLGSPTRESLEVAWTELAGASGTVLAPSGLAAVAVALLSCLGAGDHLLVPDSVYRPTRTLCDGLLKRLGVATTYYDPLLPPVDVSALFTERTRAVFLEAPGSQTFEMQDVPGLCALAHARGALAVMDNTWATPIFFPPHDAGVDLAIEAGTKYLGGHSDLLLGLVSASERAWGPLKETSDALSACPGPEDVFLALRGLRTMKLRLEEAERRALEVARWLETRPEVLRVMHPGLESDPGHAIWKRDFRGSSGLFGVVLQPTPIAAVHAMVDGLQLFGIGASWGGYESLVTPFDCTPYRTVTRFAPGGPTLRLQIGLEDVSDLIADLEAGFDRLRAASA
jgi:cysteine-S-conjugate beta-lyase